MQTSGSGLGYLVLFTEIGFTLLVTTLLGALGGYWLDGRLDDPAVRYARLSRRRRYRDVRDLQAGESLPGDDRLTADAPQAPATNDRARRDAALPCVERAQDRDE